MKKRFFLLSVFLAFLCACSATTSNVGIGELAYTPEGNYSFSQSKAPHSIAGEWLHGPNDTPYRVTGDQNFFRAEEIVKSVEGIQFEGKINGNIITGVALQDLTWYENGRSYTHKMTGTISPDGKTITLRHRIVINSEVVGRRITNSYYTDWEHVLRRKE